MILVFDCQTAAFECLRALLRAQRSARLVTHADSTYSVFCAD